MPRYLVPKKSGVHRAACFALYRALLRQAPRIFPSKEQRLPLKNRITAQFRKNARVQSPIQITLVLKLGYESLHTLRALASSNLPSAASLINRLSTSLSNLHVPEPPIRLPYTVPDPVSLYHPPKPKHPKLPRVKQLTHAYPHATPVLSRPYPFISGPRHIPILVHANGLPMLRFKKPQSPYLSRVLRDKIAQRMRQFEGMHEMEAQVAVSREEDVWDRAVEQVGGLRKEGGGSWAKAFQDAKYEFSERLTRERDRRIKLARRMFEIVEKEKELKRKEEKEGEGRKRGALGKKMATGNIL